MYASIKKIIATLKEGKMVIIVDDEGRENEGDLIIPASFINEKQMTQMINDTSGIICVALDTLNAQRLELPLMVPNNQSVHHTNFTVSIDHKDCHTGISAAERLLTVQTMAEINVHPDNFVRPGHIFPLIAHPKGIKFRQGHTEAALELCHLTQAPPFAVLSELMNRDGTVKKGKEIEEYAAENDLPIMSIESLIKEI